ncbi:TlpA family protein disulfide reductase [Brevibacillus sp. 179-C9.3 HS]|uniref:TlpA family protein disulfide reductase n=1 Tax=unclassified Brevibacillus TaxID=2684853 RepID=UPI0039A029FC
MLLAIKASFALVFVVIFVKVTALLKQTQVQVHNFHPFIPETGPAIGTQLQSLSFRTLNGQEHRLDHLPRPLIVNFTHTGCGHCASHVHELLSEGGELTAASVIISTESEQLSTSQWLQENKIAGIPVLIGNSPMLETYQINHFPSIFVIDEQDVVRAKPVSAVDTKKKLLALAGERS